MTTLYTKDHNGNFVETDLSQTLMSKLPKGCHVVKVEGSGATMWYRIDPDVLPLTAAGMLIYERLSSAIYKASTFRPSTDLTDEEMAAWQEFQKKVPGALLTSPSAAEVARKTIDLLVEEARKLLTHDVVREAYDQFITLSSLTKDVKNDA